MIKVVIFLSEYNLLRDCKYYVDMFPFPDGNLHRAYVSSEHDSFYTYCTNGEVYKVVREVRCKNGI